MTVSLSADLSKQVELELASGRFSNADQFVEEAVRQFIEERERGQRQLESLRRVGLAVDQAGLYEGVFLPGRE